MWGILMEEWGSAEEDVGHSNGGHGALLYQGLHDFLGLERKGSA